MNIFFVFQDDVKRYKESATDEKNNDDGAGCDDAIEEGECSASEASSSTESSSESTDNEGSFIYLFYIYLYYKFMIIFF